RSHGHRSELTPARVSQWHPRVDRPGSYRPGRTEHFDYIAEPAGSLCPLLRSHSHLWALVVAGLSTRVLATLAWLLRGSPVRVCVGTRHYGWSRFLLRRF